MAGTARSGRKPTPTNLRILRGNPSGEPLPKREPKPKRRKAAPPAPAYLSGRSAEIWRELVKQLHHGMQVLTDADHRALALLCDTLARYEQASAEITKPGQAEVVYTDKGNPIQNPWLSIQNRAATDALRLMQEFGLTPSSRARVSTVEDGADPYADLFG